MRSFSHIRNFGKYYWKSTLVALVILHLSTAPGTEFSQIPSFPYEDKCVHFLMYFGFAFALLWDSGRRFGLTAAHNKNIIAFSIALPIAFGGSMELFQQFLTTTRSGDWFDELANSMGTIAGFLSCRLLLPTLLRIKR